MKMYEPLELRRTANPSHFNLKCPLKISEHLTSAFFLNFFF